MPALSGRNGVVKYKTKTLVNIDHWDCTISGDMLDVTSFSTAGVQWRSFLPGLSAWTGSLSGHYNFTDTSGQKVIQTNILTPATGTLKLYLSDSGGETLSGSVYWQSEAVNVDIADTEKVVFSFQGNGALSFSTTG
jgi:predicted secreted protein